jgi:hypothetical protein
METAGYDFIEPLTVPAMWKSAKPSMRSCLAIQIHVGSHLSSSFPLSPKYLHPMKSVLSLTLSTLLAVCAHGDFILEFEFKVAPGMNSGVQFRSEFFEKETEISVDGKTRKVPADRVFGYQYEIDPSARSYTGGVYDEARRGWLRDLKENEEARKAFKGGEWNKARIECKGDHIQTFINGVKAAEITDSLTLKGIIGLQVHGIGKKEPGEEVRWRNIRIRKQ